MILEELEKAYEKYGQERNVTISLDELDSIFFIRDYIQKEKYVSTNLGRAICYRITETYYSWINFIHRLIMPNPNSLLDLKESKLFEDKEELIAILNKMVELTSRNSLIGIKKDIEGEKKFIEDALSLWKSISPILIKNLTEINAMWKNEKKESAQRMSYSG